MRIISADSGAALLNDGFEAVSIVAAAAVLVEPPYRMAKISVADPIFAKVEESHGLIVHELELCQELLKMVKADVVHLDMSFGGMLMEELSPIQLSNMKLSSKARGHVLKILPKLRKLATDIKRAYDVEVSAIGKDSIPVRIAELTTGAYAVIYVAEKAVKEKKKMRVGLPSKCYARVTNGSVTVHSLMAAEHDIAGFAKDEEGVLEKVTLAESLNPCVRGFRVLELTPKKV
ncbi:MAG: DUF4152 family protein [Candidatus Bathyarchaeia archaeon]|nr:DUF4152 family protein [Candidatus Bathyarchaeota archaeon A05DMB-4]MDH7595716.1 DUF4152 family protein [Candidatus Bathyarchaeota archaeon]